MRIKLIVLDVDGTMTDGSIYYDSEGNETKAFNVKDGLGIASWIRMGREVAIITGRKSAIVSKRAEELKIHYCRQGVKDKLKELKEIIDELGITEQNVAVIGDDWNDYEMLKYAGLSFVPSDASYSVRHISDYILDKRGGEGAVREMIDILIEEEGLEEEMRALWSAESK